MTATQHSARCRSLVERLSRFIDGELSAAQRRAVLAHLRQCPCCDDFVAGLRRALMLCHEAGRTRPPAAVRARARSRVRRLLRCAPRASNA